MQVSSKYGFPLNTGSLLPVFSRVKTIFDSVTGLDDVILSLEVSEIFN